MLEKKSALMKFLIFFGEMSVMTIEGFKDLVISYGLKLDQQEESYYGFYKDMVVIIYDDSYEEATVWIGTNFSDYMNLKSEIEAILKNTLIELKDEELKNKLGKIKNDFQ